MLGIAQALHGKAKQSVRVNRVWWGAISSGKLLPEGPETLLPSNSGGRWNLSRSSAFCGECTLLQNLSCSSSNYNWLDLFFPRVGRVMGCVWGRSSLNLTRHLRCNVSATPKEVALLMLYSLFWQLVCSGLHYLKLKCLWILCVFLSQRCL